MSLSYLLVRHRRNIVNFIEPRPTNYKLNRSSNTNYSNISYKMRTSQRLLLGGASQQVQVIGRIHGGTTQFGNFYLGQPLSLNYLGRSQGQPGGGGSPPRNIF
jgi:hypothetical protein